MVVGAGAQLVAFGLKVWVRLCFSFSFALSLLLSLFSFHIEP